MLNKIMLIGRLGRDPETRFTGSGKPVSNFSIATDESYKDRNGEKVQKTEWFNCVAWGKLAEIIQKYVTKGMLIYVDGRGNMQEWVDKEGAKRQKFVVTVNNMKMLGGGNRQNQPHDEAEQDDSVVPEVSSNEPTISDEDISF